MTISSALAGGIGSVTIEPLDSVKKLRCYKNVMLPIRKTTPKNRKADPRPRMVIRFFNEEDFNLVRSAADRSRLSINGWLMRVSMIAARREMRNVERAAS